MEAENGVHLRILQDAGITHPFAPCTILFSRLKDEFHRSVEIVFQLAEHSGRTNKTTRVTVVSAGVHFVLNLRLVREITRLLNRQCVHVCPKGQARTALFRPEGCDNPRPRDT